MTVCFNGTSRRRHQFLVGHFFLVLLLWTHLAASAQTEKLSALSSLTMKAQACGVKKDLPNCKTLPPQIRREFDLFRVKASDGDLFGVAFSVGSILRDVSKRNDRNELKAAFGEQAIEYFKIASDSASKAKNFAQQAAAINEAIYLYRSLRGITSDGKRNFGPRENLKGLIPLQRLR